ncbi:hypothetical protein [Thiorhodospira sibirica]|uniref:hypothetical protein n=1 Tax=Thiorhodospira sibirica TaxID=154347 RepID=UPI00022C39EC|nr:hypothetical protein [Thiorhodospira sibirica]
MAKASNEKSKANPSGNGTRKILDELKLSAEELFRLAHEQKIYEVSQIKEEKRAEISALRKERRNMRLRHKAEIREINKKIEELRELTSVVKSTKKMRTGKGRISQKVLDLIASADNRELSTQVIRDTLAAQGEDVSNINQTLSYLKNTHRLTSHKRGMYSMPNT